MLRRCFVCPDPHYHLAHLFTYGVEFLLYAGEAYQSSQIDTEKLAQLAGFSSGKSANASWLVIKKKLMSGATVDAAAPATTPKKAKGKAAVDGDAKNDDDEVTPTISAPKKRGKAIKTEPADAEGGDADTEKTPSAEPAKKSRAKKGTAVSKTEVNGNAPNDMATPEVTTPTPKRKRGPNKPKDPNATPTKRAKKGANATTTETNGDNAANAQPHAGANFAGTIEGDSMLDADTKVKNEGAEAEEGNDRPFDAENQNADNDTHTEGEVA